MAITYHNSASTPADNGTNASATIAVTPPASMTTGDLVYFCGHTRNASGTLAISEASGQTWNALPTLITTNIAFRGFWARYNGTWGANPSIVVTSGSSPYSAVMHVFRPTNTSKLWAVDQNQQEAGFAAVTTVTVTGQTTTQSNTVTIASWVVPDDVSWINLAGTGWATSGSAQYRNTSGLDQSTTYAHKIQTSAGATGNVSKDQSTNGPDAGAYTIITFYESDPPTSTLKGLMLLGLGN